MREPRKCQSDLQKVRRDVALSALYETQCWLTDLQARSAKLEDSERAIIRGIAVRLQALNDATFWMLTDEDASQRDILASVEAVYGRNLSAVDDDATRNALGELLRAGKGECHA